ncbi:hypothetical protein [Brevundimonas sp. R86498]|uniref:hypothetical protein n=1 Tax=Brevundimonas sp. R86498 TaxID=3093845 RepID=UPI0037CACA88
MSMRFFKVTLEGPHGIRSIVAPSPTEVQAGDAAAVGARPGEALVSIEEVDSEYQEADVLPPTSQTDQLSQPDSFAPVDSARRP